MKNEKKRHPLVRVTDADWQREADFNADEVKRKRDASELKGLSRAKRALRGEKKADADAVTARHALLAGQPVESEFLHLSDWDPTAIDAAVATLRERHPDIDARRVRAAVKWCARSYKRGYPVRDEYAVLTARAIPRYLPPLRTDPGYAAWYKARRRREAGYRAKERGSRIRRDVRAT